LKIIVPVLVCFLLEIIAQEQPIDPIPHLVQVPRAVVLLPLLHHLLLQAAVHLEVVGMGAVGIEIIFSKKGSLKV
jgi:hypothetical protein